jgi:hypothetical protein
LDDLLEDLEDDDLPDELDREDELLELLLPDELRMEDERPELRLLDELRTDDDRLLGFGETEELLGVDERTEPDLEGAL